VATVALPSTKQIIFGEQGVVMFRYIGVNDYSYHRGTFTGIEYEFGLLARLRGLIDKRDAADILLVKEDGLLAFDVEI
jgi:hypothetical protein